MPKYCLEGHDLSLKRGECLLWEGIHLKINSGELLQIAGKNGSGKTSLLRVLAGLAPVDRGRLTWGGLAIELDRSLYYQQIHYLGHQTAVKTELTVWENLQFNLNKSLTPDEISQVIETVGLSSHQQIYGFALSQGQKQRVGLARMLLHEVPLWILDEPFAGLDEGMTACMQKLLADKLNRGGLVILTTHRPLTSLAPLGRSLNL